MQPKSALQSLYPLKPRIHAEESGSLSHVFQPELSASRVREGSPRGWRFERAESHKPTPMSSHVPMRCTWPDSFLERPCRGPQGPTPAPLLPTSHHSRLQSPQHPACSHPAPLPAPCLLQVAPFPRSSPAFPPITLWALASMSASPGIHDLQSPGPGLLSAHHTESLVWMRAVSY